MKTPKHYTLEARFGKKRIKRSFANLETASAEAKELTRQNPQWGSPDFLVITRKP